MLIHIEFLPWWELQKGLPVGCIYHGPHAAEEPHQSWGSVRVQ